MGATGGYSTQRDRVWRRGWPFFVILDGIAVG